MRVALVYDRVNTWGGAEQVLLALHGIWPDAPLYTAVYDPATASWAKSFRVIPSFLQSIPFVRRAHELLAWVTPMAFESFDFDMYDVVISVTSADAKRIVTGPNTLHICYCLTPTRYLWSGYDTYVREPGLGVFDGMARMLLKRSAAVLRRWDRAASSRPDHYIAISHAVASRIGIYYQQNAQRVIYPPVDIDRFMRKRTSLAKKPGEYFLTVCRLVGYKRVDLLIDACTNRGLPLVVVGRGRDMRRLKRRAGPTIQFVGAVSDRELQLYYEKARAFVYAAEEDFGIAAVEAQAAGVPVIAYGKGGIAEIVVPGKTGELFDIQSVECVTTVLERSWDTWYDSALCVVNAKRFSRRRFVTEMKQTVSALYNTRTL
jgi:glycosyltransferase involved in cell wall biosynthesis